MILKSSIGNSEVPPKYGEEFWTSAFQRGSDNLGGSSEKNTKI